MSASETRQVTRPSLRITSARIMAPPTMTSSRPGTIPGRPSRAARSSVARARYQCSTSSAVSTEWWMRSRSYSARPCCSDESVVTVPASPTSLGLSAKRGCSTTARSSSSPTIASAAASSATVGGSSWRNRSATRTQPSCSETAASSGSSGPSPATSSVEPPPMSSTREGPPSPSRSARAPAIERAPSSLPVSSSGSTPTAARARRPTRRSGWASRRRRPACSRCRPRWRTCR